MTEPGAPHEPEPEDARPGEPGGAPFGLPGFGFAGLEGANALGIDLAALVQMLQSPGPVNWELARQVAAYVANDGRDDEPVADATATQLQELARAAQTHIVAASGLAATFRAPMRVLGPRAWTDLHLEALRPVLEALAARLGDAMRQDLAEEPAGPGDQDPLAALVPMLAPLLLGLQAGSMVGYLARHALGRYDLPLPAADEPTLCFVVANIDEFERAWSLTRADLRFYLAIHEVVHAATRSVPWVRNRLVQLTVEYVSSYEIDARNFEERFGTLDVTDLSSMQALAERPEDLLGAMQTPRQLAVLERIQVFTAALEGYCDTLLSHIGAALIPTYAQVHEAMKRHRIERGEAERFVESLLGLHLDRVAYERGEAFSRGVVERAGLDGLNRLWEREEMVPTPSELDAPGLWLARIELTD